MLPVFLVYPSSACVSNSTHEAALPGPVYPYLANHDSTELHPVKWVPGPWVKQTKKVFADSGPFMLDGHDTGMMIPHLSPVMDNMMLPLTMLGSSCKWPFKSMKLKSEKKGHVGFFPGIAPYLHCDSPKKQDEGSDTAPKTKHPLAKDREDQAASSFPSAWRPGSRSWSSPSTWTC